MPLENLPRAGTLYVPNHNGIAWSQPEGPGTAVFPAQNNSAFSAYPVPGQIFAETGSALWIAGCGHGHNVAMIYRDYDNMLGVSVAVQVCPECSYIIAFISPYEAVYDVTKFPILLG